MKVIERILEEPDVDEVFTNTSSPQIVMDTTIGRYLFAQFISFESNGWNDDETSTGVAFGVLMYII